jgi:hypothetical protein
MPPKGLLGNFVVAPSDRCPATANLLSLNANLAIPRVFSASKSSDCVVTHRSDPPVTPVRCCCTSVFGLQSWLCGSTKEPSGFLVNHRRPRELGVAYTNLHSWLDSHVVQARHWFWGSTKKPSMTASCRSCHHAACTWIRWPPGPSNQAYLSSPHLEASPTMTFRTCSSPAPTPVKPQPAPAILSQESVHTTLSITQHTRKRPSTGPRTTQVLNLPLDECIDNTHILVTKEKRKRNSNKPSKAKGKAKSKITWRRQVSVPLGKGNGSTQPRQKHAQAKSTSHQSKARKSQRASPAHMQTPLK